MFLGILAPFSPRLRDLGVIFVGINEAHVHTYFGYLSLVLSGFNSSCHFWPFLTELADLAKTGLKYGRMITHMFIIINDHLKTCKISKMKKKLFNV